jgi:hypothetical protein
MKLMDFHKNYVPVNGGVVYGECCICGEKAEYIFVCDNPKYYYCLKHKQQRENSIIKTTT